MPSSRTAVPSTEPESIQLSVFTPMADLGEARCTCGSWAQRSPSARSPVESPGQITPPRNTRSASTTLKVVAVPRSTVMTGSGKFAAAYAASTSRSLPTAWSDACSAFAESIRSALTMDRQSARERARAFINSHSEENFSRAMCEIFATAAKKQ